MRIYETRGYLRHVAREHRIFVVEMRCGLVTSYFHERGAPATCLWCAASWIRWG